MWLRNKSPSSRIGIGIGIGWNSKPRLNWICFRFLGALFHSSAVGIKWRSCTSVKAYPEGRDRGCYLLSDPVVEKEGRVFQTLSICNVLGI